jgi:acyl-coenzyme A synthetase/AMP-(fatty) acid ligase
MLGHTTMMQALCGGHRLVTMQQFEPRTAWRLIEQERVSILAVPPVTLDLLLRTTTNRHDLSSLQFVGVGGEQVPPELMERATAHFPCPVIVAYGSTELGGPVLATEVRDTDDVRATTVGHAFHETEYRVVGPDGQSLPAGEVGELVCRVDGVEAADAEGWYRTGDTAVADEQGNVKILGRRDDIVDRGSGKVQLREIEQLLLARPDVAEAVVVAAGRRVWAYVVPGDGATISASDLHGHCGHELATYKVPDKVLVCRELPKTADGQVLRAALDTEAPTVVDTYP